MQATRLFELVNMRDERLQRRWLTDLPAVAAGLHVALLVFVELGLDGRKGCRVPRGLHALAVPLLLAL